MSADRADPTSCGDLAAFYDEAYAGEGARSPTFARWRALGAVGKAEHVIALCRRGGIDPGGVLEVGCGDGALLAELRRRGFGRTLHGVEVTQVAADVAARRPEIDSVRVYDGEHLPADRGQYDLGVISHVLEHVPEPAPLLAETARTCRAVVVEVPLEDNVSARRKSKREQAHEIGHLQRLSRSRVRAIVAQAGLEIAGELEDPLPRAIHTFFAVGARDKALASAKWLVRASAHRASPSLARRLFTVHYACLCVPRSVSR
jgi:SAM-dependent methyltransferase